MLSLFWEISQKGLKMFEENQCNFFRNFPLPKIVTFLIGQKT